MQKPRIYAALLLDLETHKESHKSRSSCDMYNYGIVSLSHVDAVHNFGLYINSLIDCISSSSSIRTVGDLHPFLKTFSRFRV